MPYPFRINIGVHYSIEEAVIQNLDTFFTGAEIKEFFLPVFMKALKFRFERDIRLYILQNLFSCTDHREIIF